MVDVRAEAGAAGERTAVTAAAPWLYAVVCGGYAAAVFAVYRELPLPLRHRRGSVCGLLPLRHRRGSVDQIRMKIFLRYIQNRMYQKISITMAPMMTGAKAPAHSKVPRCRLTASTKNRSIVQLIT